MCVLPPHAGFLHNASTHSYIFEVCARARACVCVCSWPLSRRHLHLGCISERKCLNCPFTRVCMHACARALGSGHLSGRWGAEEAHQGLTREDQRAHYHAFSLPLTLLFTSNKRPTGLSLRLLSADNGTCPEPKEMNYLPRPSCTLERK